MKHYAKKINLKSKLTLTINSPLISTSQLASIVVNIVFEYGCLPREYPLPPCSSH